MGNNQIAEMLMIILVIMLFILFTLIGIFIILKIKASRSENENKKEEVVSNKSKVQQNYDVQSIFNFMEFDKIEDNMIVQSKNKKFLMVIKCQGINYDLMSGVEKTSVEQGFIQYLNTLRHPIQIYVQTRTVDLSGSLKNYKEKVRKLGDNLMQKEYDYNQKVRSGEYTKEQLNRQNFEVTKARNLYEYGADIVNNTERMSLNKNILSKQYYIIIPYYSDEVGVGDYNKDEIENMAFAELYTRCQSTISLLSVCGISSKILDSVELTNLLYMAYNRDEAERYDLQKAINSGYDQLYVTAQDVLDKKMKALDERIEKEAIKKANEAVLRARHETEKERQLKKKEAEFDDLMNKMAQIIIDNNKGIIGADVAQRAKDNISNEGNKKEAKEVTENGQKETKKPGRPRKAV